MNNTTWRIQINAEMKENGETWEDVESCTLSDDELDKEFNSGYGMNEGEPFTLWTVGYVYFPVNYDGSEWVASVPRHPDGLATQHIGGG